VASAGAVEKCKLSLAGRRLPRSALRLHSVLQEFFGGIEFAVFAGVVERDVGVGALFAEIDLARIEGLGIDVDADGALAEFGQIENLVDGLEGIDVGRMGCVHFVDVGGDDAARAVGGVAVIHAEILDFQAANGSRHPTVLVAMIVDAAGLTDFPADGHTLEDVVFENEIAGVIAFGEEEIFVERLRADGMAKDVVLNIREGEFVLGNAGETFDPVSDCELFGGHLLVHEAPQIEFGKREPSRDYSARERRSRIGEGLAEMELLGKSKEELREFCTALGEPAYRGGQIYHALYAERKFNFAQMTNLPAALRERLTKEARITVPEVKQRFTSADGSMRYLFALANAEPPERKELTTESTGKNRTALPTSVEAVFMPSEGRQTICISTQAGCAVDCQFCLTAQLGLIRNLSAGEIVGQVLLPLEEQKARLAPPFASAPLSARGKQGKPFEAQGKQTNIVLMGQGEPLLNFDAAMGALRILLDSEGVGLSPKHVTLSTSGIVPGIERLAQEKVRPKLAISLNASNDEQRDAVMPINKKYPLSVLLEACKKYPLRPWEHLTFEYVMLGGVNDAPEDARRVVKLLAPLKSVKVNLIPWNPGALPYREPTAERIEEFRRILNDKGVPAFVRYSRGRDVMAACGQLALLQIDGSASSAATPH
jgi:23S rRNA (adenine2503-C2)-methyltransferase